MKLVTQRLELVGRIYTALSRRRPRPRKRDELVLHPPIGRTGHFYLGGKRTSLLWFDTLSLSAWSERFRKWSMRASAAAA
jgi:hypothetical protein